ncbi:MAG: Maf family protein [Syntrophomonadaceae bacterium]|jgi:septum formation protein
MRNIILASQSPRRRILLSNLGVKFSCISIEANEVFYNKEDPVTAVQRIALQKADLAADRLQSGIIITADTIVVLHGEIMGKPADDDDAFRMLSMLSGNRHRVITGLCVKDLDNQSQEVVAETTWVYFRQLSEEEIVRYIATGEPQDKAGAYGIQGYGAVLIEKIEGCYFNVVGLPLSRLYQMLKKQGIEMLPGGAINERIPCGNKGPAG